MAKMDLSELISDLDQDFLKTECVYDYQDELGNTIIHEMINQIGYENEFITASKIIRLIDTYSQSSKNDVNFQEILIIVRF